MRQKPLIYIPDDSPRFHSEGWEPPSHSGLVPMVVVGVLVGVVLVTIWMGRLI